LRSRLLAQGVADVLTIYVTTPSTDLAASCDEGPLPGPAGPHGRRSPSAPARVLSWSLTRDGHRSRCASAFDEQERSVREWFRTAFYETRGRGYLRPPEALPDLPAAPRHLARPAPSRTFACGAGLLLRAARERSLRATGVDLSSVAVAMVPRVAPGATALEANAQELPFETAPSDYVTCIGSLERFLDRVRCRAARDAPRVAAPGARVLPHGPQCAHVPAGKVLTQGPRPREATRATQDDRHARRNGPRSFAECWRSRCVASIPDQWFWQKWRHRIIARRAGRARAGGAAAGAARLRQRVHFIL
jgi:hypothetical protein